MRLFRLIYSYPVQKKLTRFFARLFRINILVVLAAAPSFLMADNQTIKDNSEQTGEIKKNTVVEPEEKEALDLLEIYKMALEHDAQLAIAKATYQADKELLPQGRAALLPSIMLSGKLTNTSSSRGSLTGINSLSDGTGKSWSATLSQPLFNLEAWFSYGQAKAITEQARVQYSSEQQNLILRVAEAYFNILKSEDSLETAEAQEKAVKRQLDQARQRFRVGLIAETDVHEARAAYDNARVIRINAVNQFQVSLESMRTIIDVPIDRVAYMDKRMPVDLPTPSNVQSWVDAAMKQNFSIAKSKFALEAAEQQVKASRSKHVPTVDAIASYSYDDDTSLKDSMFNGKNETTVIGLQLDFPLYTGGGISAKARESNYKMLAAENSLDNTKRTVLADASNLFRTVVSDVDRIEARCQGIISARSALKATESGYQVGTRNIVDVLDAQKMLYSAQSDYLNARYEFIINTLKLKQNAGTLSPQDLSDLNRWMTVSKEDTLALNCK